MPRCACLLNAINVAPYYLVYFMVDKTVSVIKGNAIVEENSDREVGKLCRVKEKSKLYEGKIVTYGTELF